MKYRNLILSVLCWLVASVSLAVTLPKSSFSIYDGLDNGNDSYTLGIGTTFSGSAVLYSNQEIDITVCTIEGVAQDPDVCGECCFAKILSVYDDEVAHELCIDSCTKGVALNESPTGEALLLIPFALAYALIRRRRKASEVA